MLYQIELTPTIYHRSSSVTRVNRFSGYEGVSTEIGFEKIIFDMEEIDCFDKRITE